MNPDILAAAELCRLSYQDALPPGFTDVDDLRFGIVEVAGKTFIVIRGTANMSNWLRDARVRPMRTCNGYLAHAGFVAAYRKLCSGGMPTIKGADVIATGHSLGGAVATLLAEHIGCKLISFGSPRVYMRFFASPDIDHDRVVNDDDPVTMIPRILYRHLQEPTVTLRDNDHQLIDVADHSMSVYCERLKGFTPPCGNLR